MNYTLSGKSCSRQVERGIAEGAEKAGIAESGSGAPEHMPQHNLTTQPARSLEGFPPHTEGGLGPHSGASAPPQGAGGVSPLVKIGKSAAIGSLIRLQADTDDETKRLREVRAERWALKAAAEHALKGTGDGKKLWRCQRYRLGSEVELWRDPLRNSASYRQLETCHSVWMCPLCSAKVSERRRLELSEGLRVHREKKGQVLFWTLTFPHSRYDDLSEILSRFLAAIRLMNSTRGYKDVRRRFGVVGYVRALEVTHSERNGWHPHAHILLFLERELTGKAFGELYLELHRLWSSAVQAKGLDMPRMGVGSHLLVATGSVEDTVAAYFAKWGVQPTKVPRWTSAHELTKASSKRGRAAGRSPWDLLREVLADDSEASGRLFAEYAGAFKGKRQLTWTPGLRAALGLVVELTDEELAAAPSEDDCQALMTFDVTTWRRIVRADAQCAILDAAGLAGAEGVYAVLAELEEINWTGQKYEPRPRSLPMPEFLRLKPQQL